MTDDPLSLAWRQLCELNAWDPAGLDHLPLRERRRVQKDIMRGMALEALGNRHHAQALYSKGDALGAAQILRVSPEARRSRARARHEVSALLRRSLSRGPGRERVDLDLDVDAIRHDAEQLRPRLEAIARLRSRGLRERELAALIGEPTGVAAFLDRGKQSPGRLLIFVLSRLHRVGMRSISRILR
jgi:hypothetical protein